MWMLTNEDPAAPPADGADAAAAAAASASAVAAEGGATPPPAVDSLIVDPDAAAAAATGDAWLPEKFRVMGADGKLDEAASARKLAASYTELERTRGEPAPGKPEDYKLEAEADVEGIDFEAFKADPMCQGFLKGAHAKGMTNAQVNYAINEYMKLAPQLMEADAKLSAAEARTELGKLWTDPAVLNANLGKVSQAIKGFGGEAEDMPGSRSRLFAKFGSDPDFIAFAARVAGEMGEDKQPVAGLSNEADIDALMKSKPYWDPTDPQHEQTKAKVAEFYARKHGNTRK